MYCWNEIDHCRRSFDLLLLISHWGLSTLTLQGYQHWVVQYLARCLILNHLYLYLLSKYQCFIMNPFFLIHEYIEYCSKGFCGSKDGLESPYVGGFSTLLLLLTTTFAELLSLFYISSYSLC